MIAETALCWGSLPDADIFELADAAGFGGFEEITITAGHYLKALERGASEAGLRHMLASAGIRVGVIDPLMSVLPGLPPLDQVRPDWRHFFNYSAKDCFAAAEALGARTVNLAHFLGSPRTPPSAIAEAIVPLSLEASQRRLRLSIEFIPGTGIPDLARALDIVRLTGAENVGVMFDTWHFLRSEGTWADLFNLRPGQIFELQLSDRREPAHGETYMPMTGRLPPGEGEAPLAEILDRILARSAELVVGVEVFRAGSRAPRTVAIELSDATRTFLAARP